jgi:hypothetical protein
VQGRKSRVRTPDDIELLIRRYWAEGIHRFFITDDNFARNKDWERIFDRLIELRERDKLDIRLIIQVDTLCHKTPNFIDKAARAGVNRVFIGLENINPANLAAAKKRQNKITGYRKMLLAWKQARVITYAGYIQGFPNDTPESIREDIEIIKRELPIDILEFFCLTPLPGSEDHQVLSSKGVWLDHDMNKYDGEHVVTGHPRIPRSSGKASIARPGGFITRPNMSRRFYAAPRPSIWDSRAFPGCCLYTPAVSSSRTYTPCRAASSAVSTASTVAAAWRSNRFGSSIPGMFGKP